MNSKRVMTVGGLIGTIALGVMAFAGPAVGAATSTSAATFTPAATSTSAATFTPAATGGRGGYN